MPEQETPRRETIALRDFTRGELNEALRKIDKAYRVKETGVYLEKPSTQSFLALPSNDGHYVFDSMQIYIPKIPFSDHDLNALVLQVKLDKHLDQLGANRAYPNLSEEVIDDIARQGRLISNLAEKLRSYNSTHPKRTE